MRTQTTSTFNNVIAYCNARRRHAGDTFTISQVHLYCQGFDKQISYSYVANIVKNLRIAGYLTRIAVGIYMCTEHIPSTLTTTKLTKQAYPIFKYSKDTYEVSVFIKMFKQNVKVVPAEHCKDAIRQLDMQLIDNTLYVSFKVEQSKLTQWPKACHINVIDSDKLAYDKNLQSLTFIFD